MNITSPAGTMFIAVVAFAMTILWMAAHAAGLVIFLKRRNPSEPPPSRMALGAWIVGFGGGFTGPLVILFNLVALGLGVAELLRVRSGSSPTSSRLPATIAVITASIIVVMGAALGAFVLAMSA